MQEWVSIVFGLGGILGMLYTFYVSVRKPQEELDKRQLMAAKDIDNRATTLAQQEAEGKANLLAQQVTLQKEANEKKFTEIGLRLNTIDSKVADLGVASNLWQLEIRTQLTRLATIIEERIPRLGRGVEKYEDK